MGGDDLGRVAAGGGGDAGFTAVAQLRQQHAQIAGEFGAVYSRNRRGAREFHGARIVRHAVHHNLVMQMRPGGFAAFTHIADDLVLLDRKSVV